jgi:hypothetical protein
LDRAGAVSRGAADCCIRRDRDSRREFAGPPIPSKHDHVVRRHEPLPKVGAVPITSCRFARRSGHLITAPQALLQLVLNALIARSSARQRIQRACD